MADKKKQAQKAHRDKAQYKFTYAVAMPLEIKSYGANERYIEQHRFAKRDFTRNVPCQRIETFPVSGNRGLYGWTLLPSDGKIRRREDLYGTIEGLITDTHENIHTPDEKETRYFVDDILAPLLEWLTRENNKYPQKHSYKKHLPPNY